MANLKSLAKDTAIYGLSSIVARFINYLLVPIQTARFAASGGEYGIITNVYAYVSLLIILLTFGMETTFFRFMSKEGEDPRKVYSTALTMVMMTSLVSALLLMVFLYPIATAVGYADHPEYVAVMYVTVAIDAFMAIPFAYLRYLHKPLRFALLKIINIVLNITLNLLYLIVLPALRLNPLAGGCLVTHGHCWSWGLQDNSTKQPHRYSSPTSSTDLRKKPVLSSASMVPVSRLR